MSGDNIQPEQGTSSKGELQIYNGMNEVFEHARAVINTMQNGEKIAIRDLADKVSAQVKTMSSANVMNLVQMFCKQSKEVSVEVGRGGGVFKGGKPKRIDNRARCKECNQILRAETSKSKIDTDQDDE